MAESEQDKNRRFHKECYSLATMISWRRYALLLVGAVLLSVAMVVLDSMIGIGLPWTYWIVMGIYVTWGMLWTLPYPKDNENNS